MQKPDQKRSGNARPGSGSCDFLIRIQFRQNATWQGEIEWLYGGRKSHRWFFRSLLEMVCLMEDALEKEGGVKATSRLRSWDDCESSQDT